jgi:uncharacterized repeat protein (TIGR03803 family)
MNHFKQSPRRRVLVSATARVVGSLAISVAVNIVAASSAWAQNFQVLYSFSGAPDDGELPLAPLIQAADGNFYGTTTGGGPFYDGTVFRMTPDGTVTLVHAFAGGTEGRSPDTALLQATDGNFYGTVSWIAPQIFRMTPDGTLTTLYSWPQNPVETNGWLIQATDGNFYGTTAEYTFCNMSNVCYTQPGTAFRITPNGSYTDLAEFWGGVYGRLPTAALVQANDGWLYTTTAAGGDSQGSGSGTVVRLSTLNQVSQVTHNFSGPQGATDGVTPEAPLLQGKDGNLYGTTSQGGPAGYGTIFRIAPDGTFSVLHAFTDASIQCRFPGLIQATDGNLYGVGWGANDEIFRLAPDGTFTVLYTFPGSWRPSQLLQGSDGNLYGTTQDDGSGQFLGTVFRLTLPGL